MLQPPAVAPDPAPDPDPDLHLPDRDGLLEADDSDNDGHDASADAHRRDRHWSALAAPPNGYGFLHALLSFIAGPLLGADQSFGVAMVEHQEWQKPPAPAPAPGPAQAQAQAPAPAPGPALAPVPALASALAPPPAPAAAAAAAVTTDNEGPDDGGCTPAMTRCIGQLRVPLPVGGVVTVEFCAAGYLRSASAAEPGLDGDGSSSSSSRGGGNGGGGGGGSDSEDENDDSSSGDPPLIAIVELRGVRHRPAAVAAHLLAVAQMHFTRTGPTPTADVDADADAGVGAGAAVGATATADATTGANATELDDDDDDDDEIDAYAVGITHRPATAADAGTGDEQPSDVPLYTLYHMRIARSWFAGLGSDEQPPPLRINTSAPFDPCADGKLPLADALLCVVAALVRSGISRVGVDEARRRARAARLRRRAAAARRWEAEHEAEARARRLIALELRRAQAARACGKARQRKEPVLKMRKRRRVEPTTPSPASALSANQGHGRRPAFHERQPAGGSSSSGQRGV